VFCVLGVPPQTFVKVNFIELVFKQAIIAGIGKIFKEKKNFKYI